MPYILSLATVLTIVQLLDFLKPVYLIQVNRFWQSAEFNFKPSLVVPLAILSLIIILWILLEKPKFSLIPALGLGSFFFVSPMGSIVLVSSLCIVTCLFLSRKVIDYALGLMGLLCVMEAEALLQWLIFEPLGLVNPLIGLAELESNLFYLGAQLSPLIMLIFSSLGVVITIHHLSKSSLVKEVQEQEPLTRKGSDIVILVLLLILSVTIAVYLYLPNVNPQGANTGVDFDTYLLEFKQVEVDPSKAFQVKGGSSPLLFLLLFVFQRLTSLNALDIIRWLPIVLNPLLVLSTYFLALEMARSYKVAAYAGFFTVAGYTLTVGMYGYFLADMFMLSIILVSIGFLLSSYRTGSMRDLVIASLLGCLLVFTHPWTLDQFMAPLVATSVLVTYLYLSREKDALNPWGIISYCCVIASADVAKLLLLRGSVEGLVALGTLSEGLTSTQSFWLDLVNSSRFYVGGFLTNVPLLVLAVIGLWKVNQKNLPNMLIWLFMAMTSIVYIVGDVVIKSRVLYNVPIGILAAYGILYLDGLVINRRVKSLIHGTVVITLLACLFRELATLI